MKKFAVFGNPIEHSISPRLHNLAIKALNLDAFYGRVLLKDNMLLRDKFINLNLSGANITIPFKERAFQICDVLDSYSKLIGSVNTIVKKNDKLYGYNTDAPGFLKSIREFKNINSALVIGAGGSAKAVVYALNSQKVKVDILNRSSFRAKDFLNFNFYTWDSFIAKSYDLVINSTSAGLKDQELPAPEDIVLNILKNSKYAFDLIYNIKTPFLKLAENLEKEYKDGKDMLIYQAILSLNIFYDLKLDEKQIEIAMKKAISL